MEQVVKEFWLRRIQDFIQKFFKFQFFKCTHFVGNKMLIVKGGNNNHLAFNKLFRIFRHLI